MATIPPFVQYQGILVPLRGLWNTSPPEGDKFVNVELDWPQGPSNCVQINLFGNSPVSLSQVVALNVDNSRCGSECQFLFPDSGFVLVVPAYGQGVFPVFTNALTFYVTASAATSSDITIFDALNTMPPPVALVPAKQQETAIVQGFNLTTTSSQELTPLSGTLNAYCIQSIAPASASEQQATVVLEDGNNNLLWAGIAANSANLTTTQIWLMSDVALRFYNGLYLKCTATTLVNGLLIPNIYYSIP